jgi:hypothetical protein
LIRLATKMAPGKRASQIASTPYAASVSMVLDHLDDKRLGLQRALKSSRVTMAKDILTEIYAIEDALEVRIEDLGASEWGRRLDGLMAAVAADLQIEFQGLPPPRRPSRSRIVQTSPARGCAWNADEPEGHAGAWPPARRIAYGASERCRTGPRQEMRQANG